MGMIQRRLNPANVQLGFKVSLEEARDIKLLAAYEGVTISSYVRHTMADVVKFASSSGHPALKAPAAPLTPSDEAARADAARHAPTDQGQ